MRESLQYPEKGAMAIFKSHHQTTKERMTTGGKRLSRRAAQRLGF